MSSFFSGLTLTSITNALTAAGATPAAIATAVSTLSSGSISAQAAGPLAAIDSNPTNQALINAEVIKIEELNPPASVMGALSLLLAGGNDPVRVGDIVRDIASKLAGNL